jgi:hypothetical protein
LIGLACLEAKNIAEILIGRADHAMYQAIAAAGAPVGGLQISPDLDEKKSVGPMIGNSNQKRLEAIYESCMEELLREMGLPTERFAGEHAPQLSSVRHIAGEAEA